VLTRYTYRLGQSSETPLEKSACANLIPIENSDVVEVIQGDRTEPLLLACAAFRDSIVSSEPAPSSGEYSLRTLAALEAGAHSLAQHGTWQECAA
jgi:hypothetical protein